MQTYLVVELRDVYGGDGQTRMELVESTKLKRKTTTKQTRADLGVAAGGEEMDESRVEEIEKDVHTFRLDENANPVLRLGGPHGKLWGAMKEAAGTLRLMKVAPFSSSYYGFIRSINVQPVWVSLKMNGESLRTETLPQLLQGRGGSKMIFQKFDVVPKCTAEFRIIYPDAFEEPVKALLKQLENCALLNKRRATMKILSMKTA